ncbi:MAG: hypothetical protein FWD06_08560 [Oscillospiraceae bacterium]|nr:hypothetical protein [Oscillospiraceae bacterium]
MQFIMGVLASLTATALVAVVSYFHSRKLRDFLIRRLSKRLGIGIDKIYGNSKDSNDDVARAIQDAKFVKIFAPRGHTLLGAYSGYFTKNKPCKVLLPSTDADARYWIEQRVRERTAEPYKSSPEVLIREIDTAAHALLVSAQKDLIRFKRFNHPHIARLIITDEWAYFLPLKKDVRTSECEMVKYSSCSFMYDFWNRYFDLIWDASPDANPDEIKEEGEPS